MYRLWTAALLMALLGACTGGEPTSEVVVYTALDEEYSRPILAQFEEETGIRVRAVYDTEAAKTTGLVTRLLAERTRPRADVFWNNEIVQTIVLAKEGVLAPYASPAAEGIPAQFQDRGDLWHGFAARGRVLIYNTEKMAAPPRGIADLTDPQYRGQAAIALPLFGTTATQAAAMAAHWGDERLLEWFDALAANEVAVLAGNATVRDAVARGDYLFGFTDTDDANAGIEDGLPVAWVFPDQGPDDLGTLLIPNTLALIAGAPNAEAGKKLIDFLLRPETEAQLARTRAIQIPLHPGVAVPENVPRLETIRTVPVDFEAAAEAHPRIAAQLKARFL